MSKKRILVVDDTEVNLKLLGNLLSGKYSLSFASGGQEALDILENTLPDLVLLDIMMPEIDGFEVCRRLRSEERTKALPVVLVTAKNDKDSVVNGYLLGVLDYIIKPFDSDRILERIAKIFVSIELKKSIKEKKQREQTLPMVIDRIVELEERLDGAVKVVPELVQYLKSLEELMNSEEVQEIQTVRRKLDTIYDERLSPRLTEAVHTISENMQDMQYDLVDVIRDLEDINKKSQ